jgi:hypothetical protein
LPLKAVSSSFISPLSTSNLQGPHQTAADHQRGTVAINSIDADHSAPPFTSQVQENSILGICKTSMPLLPGITCLLWIFKPTDCFSFFFLFDYMPVIHPKKQE